MSPTTCLPGSIAFTQLAGELEPFGNPVDRNDRGRRRQRDLDSLAAGYRGFLGRWQRPSRDALDDLTCQVLLEAEWLLLIREDPRLPLVLLPDDWPGIRAEELFRLLRRELAEPAGTFAEATLDWMPLCLARHAATAVVTDPVARG